MRIKDIPEIAKLSNPEKILFVEDMWDSIISKESNVPLPNSHVNELNRRFSKYESNPGNLLTLDELKFRIEKRK